MSRDASGKLFIGAACAPRSALELFTQRAVGDARDGEGGIGDRQKQFTVFAADVQGPDTTSLLGARSDVFDGQGAHGCVEWAMRSSCGRDGTAQVAENPGAVTRDPDMAKLSITALRSEGFSTTRSVAHSLCHSVQ